MSSSDLHHFFSPKSVAIVGVSKDYHKVGHLVAKNMLLQGYMHEMHFVNPHKGKVLGHDTLSSLSDLTAPVDLVVFATPADVTLDEMGKAKSICKSVVILAAGFKEESNPESIARENRLQKIITHTDMKILGPNCAGFINTISGLNSTFLVGPVPVGHVGVISQSGAIGSVLIDHFSAHQGIGFSYFFSLGNKANIDECDTLEYLAQDDHTQVIAMYLEDIHDGQRFIHALSEATRHKPVIIIKAGSSLAGAQAAVSHTGSLAGDDVIFDTVVHQCGAIRAYTINELLTYIQIANYHVTPKSDRMIVITNAGGCGVLAADAIDQAGLTLSKLHIKSIVPNDAPVPNPYDVRGDADASKFAAAVAETGDEENVGGVIVIVTPQANTQLEDTAKSLVGLQSALTHPIYPVFLGGSSMTVVQKICESNQMPFFEDLEMLIRAIGVFVERASRPTHTARLIRQKPSRQTKSIPTALSLIDSYSALQKAGIQLAPYWTARDASTLHKALEGVIYPIVMKVSSSTITHKSDAGGVQTNISSYLEAEKTFTRMQQLEGFQQVVIQEMISGYELILGAKRDPIFGPVIVVGIGGVLTNLIHESVQFITPLGYAYAQYALQKSKLAKLVHGYRGMHPIDEGHLFEMIHIIDHLMNTSDYIQEIDINPLMLTQSGKTVGVDARVVIAK
ncbi:MAG: acetate--CoA ligase family protein [Candidatus Roizmanbacteria bacterium]